MENGILVQGLVKIRSGWELRKPVGFLGLAQGVNDSHEPSDLRSSYSGVGLEPHSFDEFISLHM